jgi:predicted RND superfamily exporter protein
MTLNSVAGLYRRIVLDHPAVIIALLLAILAFFALQARHFALDASADALLLEDDKDLQIYRAAQARYQSQDLLVVTYTPQADMLADSTLDQLAALRAELVEVESVESAFTLLDVPLMTSADIELAELTVDVPTLTTHRDYDPERVKEEIATSPVFGDLILSSDASTTALLLTLTDDEQLGALHAERSALRIQSLNSELAAADAVRLDEVNQQYDAARALFGEQRHNDIAAIRAILQNYRDDATLHLGGVPMVSDDMISYIGRDLVTFGAGVALFIVIMLTLIFRRLRWVALPLASCGFAGLLMLGLLGLVGWKVTVISSNFLSLMLIITLSMNIHLIVRFRQLCHDRPDESHRDLVLETTRRMFWPCLYTALTTIIGFSSLVFSGIKPVMDFGWMMSIGLGVTFLTSFLLFPALLIWIGPRSDDAMADKPVAATAILARFTQRGGGLVLGLALIIAVLSAIGISRLQVENSFINYFRDHTEIYQGMKLIDEQLGGTTPLEILLDVSEDEDDECADTTGMTEDELEYCEEMEFLQEDKSAADLWFTPFKIERINQVHDYLDSLPEVGKVLSLSSILRTGELINDNQPFTPFELGVLYKRIPDDIRERMIEPYISIDENEARIALRILDSQPDLRRAELLAKIRSDLQNELQIPEDKASISGILVLYNNMLQSLFQSQIQTVGAVLLGIAIMFMILFRSLSLAVIGIVPNALAAALVMGIMGLAGIPLDMMTITIATITIGIAVDNSIHYIYRFREEFPKTGNYHATMDVCHANIGRAVLYTSLTIIFGFSILVFSNFIPTILFGLLTALAMFVALLAVLTLLPRLIVLLKPFGPERMAA